MKPMDRFIELKQRNSRRRRVLRIAFGLVLLVVGIGFVLFVGAMEWLGRSEFP